MSGVFGPLGLLGRVINDLCSTCAHFRIVRNKAAEKVKEIGGYESSSPGPLSSNLTGDTSLPLRHPSYSINNILGVHQTQDANENILKRKREDDGKQRMRFSKFLIFSISRRDPRELQPVGSGGLQAGEVWVQLGLQQLHDVLHVGGRQVDGRQPVHQAGEDLRGDDGGGDPGHHHHQHLRVPHHLSSLPDLFPGQPSLLQLRRDRRHQHVLHVLQRVLQLR